MLVPVVKSRMKQARQISCLRTKPGEVCSLVEIAVLTREGQILQRVLSSVRTRRDVFNVERQRLLLLPQRAILAATRRALPDRLAQPAVHQPAFACASTRRA